MKYFFSKLKHLKYRYRFRHSVCVSSIAATQSYGLNSAKKTKKKLLAPDISLNLDRSEGSVLSDELDESTELDLDEIDTPSDNSNEFEWEGIIIVYWNSFYLLF